MLANKLALLVVRRLVALAVLLIGISLLVFSLLYLAPGSPIDVLLGTRKRDPDVIAALTAQYHLSDPFLAQYWHWLAGAVRFDFGESIATRTPVTSVIGSALEVTLPLGLMAFALTMICGVPLGIVAALKRQRTADRAIVGLSIVGVSAPVFATGLALLYVFGVQLSWFPVYGTGDGWADRLYHLVLPTAALALTGVALVVKLTRAAMITALEQDYIVSARARGVTWLSVVVRYAMRNALGPIVTTAGIVLGGLLTGTVIIEVTFSLPGIGSLLVDSVNNKDIPVVQAVAMLAGATIVLANLLADMVHLSVDPRVRHTAIGGH